jgi:choice-of-anchor B domain-containing protein
MPVRLHHAAVVGLAVITWTCCPSSVGAQEAVRSGTGGDDCTTAVETPVPVGDLGQPETVVIFGDNTDASGPDCPIQAPDPLWWEAFTIDRCARVTISLCGTTPTQRPSYVILFDECPCGTRLRPIAAARGAPVCDDENVWMVFSALPAGTYYYPIYSDEDVLLNDRGPYVLNISAEACLGACCNPLTETCVENALEDTCVGPFDEWNPGRSCCEAECRMPGEEYASHNVNLLGHVPLDAFSSKPPSANDIWGYTSPIGREYAILGLNGATAFIDITDPFNPLVLDEIPDAPSTWSDLAVYQEYAYNVNEGGGGVQVFDLTQIDDGIVTLANTITSSGIQTAHNIFVNPDSGFAYLCGSNLGAGGLIALDLSNPAQPIPIGSWEEHYVHDTYVTSYHDGPFAGREIAFNFCGPEGMIVVDVTNKANMFTLAVADYPNMTYAHQGWPDAARNYMFVDDELDELQSPDVTTTTTYVVDISNITEPAYVTSFTADVCASDHNLYVRGQYVYEANYTSGLRVYDALDIDDIAHVGHFDTHPEGNAPGFDGAWGVFAGFPSGFVIISDIQRGLFVLNYDCNENGTADAHDVMSGESLDCQSDTIPDECQYRLPADLNLDRRRNAADQAVFTSCMTGPLAPDDNPSSTYVEPCCVHADSDRDGAVDLRDFHHFLNDFAETAQQRN